MTLDDLFAAPLGDFVKVRDALAKELRAAGRKDEAAAVKAIRKPPAHVWKVNQLPRASLDEVLDGAARVARDPSAGPAWRALVHRLADGDERVERLLSAVASRPDLWDTVRAGRLLEDVEPAIFGLAPVAAASGSDTAAGADDRIDLERERARDEARRASQRAAAAGERAVRLAEEAERAREVADRARDAADEAAHEAAALKAAADAAAAHLRTLGG